MAIIDISCPIQHHPAEREDFEVSKTLLPLKSDRTSYTGVIYRLSQGSMNSSYIDLPGHIAETDDGRDGANTPPQDFFRLPCTVVRLDLSSGYGAVHAADLEKALGGRPKTPGLIINALGKYHQFSPGFAMRSVYLAMDAVNWIVDSGIKVILSDIYESTALEGVFLEFFRHGIATICEARNMHLLTGDRVLLTAMFQPWPGVTQLPCRLIAETEE